MNPVRSENPICLNPMTVAGWACGSREEVRTRCNATFHGPRYGTKRCFNVDWERMANTLCFHHDRVFGHYAIASACRGIHRSVSYCCFGTNPESPWLLHRDAPARSARLRALLLQRHVCGKRGRCWMRGRSCPSEPAASSFQFASARCR
jgi:hypothetical protein